MFDVAPVNFLDPLNNTQIRSRPDARHRAGWRFASKPCQPPALCGIAEEFVGQELLTGIHRLTSNQTLSPFS